LGVTVRSMRNCTWHAAGVGFVFALSACGAPISTEPEAPLIAESSLAPPVDAQRTSSALGDAAPASASDRVSVGDQPGETIEHPTEFSAAVFVPVECLDMDAILAELWPAAQPLDGGGVTFVAVDVAMADLRSLERTPGESAVADFDAWDRVEGPAGPELDGFDALPAPVPDA
jgi:hypothetical protein